MTYHPSLSWVGEVRGASPLQGSDTRLSALVLLADPGGSLCWVPRSWQRSSSCACSRRCTPGSPCGCCPECRRVRTNLVPAQFGDLLQGLRLPPYWREIIREKMLEAAKQTSVDTESI